MAKSAPSLIDDDPLWYKDAVIYQLHVKSFFDANNDGIGDFAGLLAKLDYIASLGVNTVWLLPFYPSPLKATTAMTSPTTGRCQPRPTARCADFKRLRRARRIPARPSRHHRAGDQPHLRPASMVPEGS